MKILYICADSGIPVFGRKGCSTHVRETARALQRDGHEVKILTPNPGQDPEGNQDEVDLRVAPPLKSKKLGADLRHYLYNWRLKAEAERLMTEFQPDGIYERYSLYSTAGADLAWRHKIPRILEVNSFLVKEQRRRLRFPWIAQFFENRLLRGATSMIVVSKPLKDAFVKMGIPAERIVIMPMAVDVQTFTPDTEPVDLHDRLGASRDRSLVGYIGTLTGWHGIDLLFPIAEKLKALDQNITLVVIGGDDQRVRERQAETRERGLETHIHFLGSVPYRDVPSYLRGLTYTLISGSHSWASPTKLFEYQACGRASIVPRYVPVEEALTHGEEGLIFEPGDVETMTEHILTLHNNPELRETMGRKARERVIQKHSWEVNTTRIVEMFETM